MITVRIVDSTHDVLASVRPPSIYLDHWALRLFSSDPACRARFLACFCTKGTLLVSWANVLEISQNAGASAKCLENFLRDIGEHWFPLEINPIRVIEREVRFRPGNDNPCFGASFLEIYYPYISDGPLSLDRLLDLTQDLAIKSACQQHIETLNHDIGEQIGKWRTDRRIDANALKFCEHRPTEYVLDRLKAIIQKEDFKVKSNDTIDLIHAIVSLAYADFVLLDKHWTDLAIKLKLPAGRVRVYSSRQIDQFLRDVEQF